MQIKLPFDTSKPICGQASVEINKSSIDIFSYIGTHFFDNYPKWAVEVIKFEPLDGKKVFVGAKAKQFRDENGEKIESTFQITVYQPHASLIFQGIDAPYKHSYLLESINQQKTRLTFYFELLEVEVFMRPFQKLIRSAIEEGAENTVRNIKNLILVDG